MTKMMKTGSDAANNPVPMMNGMPEIIKKEKSSVSKCMPRVLRNVIFVFMPDFFFHFL